MFCYDPLVSELGGPECMVPSTPVIGGRCPPPGSAAYAVPVNKLHGNADADGCVR